MGKPVAIVVGLVPGLSVFFHSAGTSEIDAKGLKGAIHPLSFAEWQAMGSPKPGADPQHPLPVWEHNNVTNPADNNECVSNGKVP